MVIISKQWVNKYIEIGQLYVLTSVVDASFVFLQQTEYLYWNLCNTEHFGMVMTYNIFQVWVKMVFNVDIQWFFFITTNELDLYCIEQYAVVQLVCVLEKSWLKVSLEYNQQHRCA